MIGSMIRIILIVIVFIVIVFIMVVVIMVVVIMVVVIMVVVIMVVVIMVVFLHRFRGTATRLRSGRIAATQVKNIEKTQTNRYLINVISHTFSPKAPVLLLSVLLRNSTS
jgi:hypothetical protein